MNLPERVVVAGALTLMLWYSEWRYAALAARNAALAERVDVCYARTDAVKSVVESVVNGMHVVPETFQAQSARMNLIQAEIDIVAGACLPENPKYAAPVNR